MQVRGFQKLSASSTKRLSKLVGQMVSYKREELPRARYHISRFSFRITAIGCAGFGVRDYVLGSVQGAMVLWATALVAVLANLIMERCGRQRLAAHMSVTSIMSMFFMVQLWDGQHTSISLWAISIVPLTAAMLLGTGAALGYALVNVLVVAVASLLPLWMQVPRIIASQPQTWLSLRLMTLTVFAVSCALISIGARMRITYITKQKRDLEAVKDRIESAIDAKNRFFAELSDDLRAPMHRIGQRVGELVHAPDLANSREDLAQLRASSVGLDLLLSRLIDLSDIESKARESKNEVLCVESLVHRIVREQKGVALAAGRSLRVQRQGHAAKLWGDPTSMARVLSILVRNALQPRESCSWAHAQDLVGQSQLLEPQPGDSREAELEPLEIVVRYPAQASMAGDGSRLRVEVEIGDQGAAMSAEQLARGFEDIDQLGKVVAGGRSDQGLGFTIAQRLCEKMGATLFFSQAQPQKSSVCVRIDLQAFVEGQRCAPSLTPALRPWRTRWLEWLLSATPFYSDEKAERFEASTDRLAFVRLAQTQVAVALFYVYEAQQFLRMGATLEFCTTLVAMLGLVYGVAVLKGPFALAKSFGWTIAGGYVVAFFRSMLEGGIVAPTLWLAPVTPMLASFILGYRASVICFVCCVVTLLAVALASPGLALDPVIHYDLLALFGSRVFNLFALTFTAVLWSHHMEHGLQRHEDHNEALKSSTALAKRSQQHKEIFFTNMSHELRTPLNGILGQADLLLTTAKAAKSTQRLREVLTDARLLLDLINRMLGAKEGAREQVSADRAGAGHKTVPPVINFGADILVVDDNAINRRVVHAQLARWGCRVFEAKDGHEAVKLAAHQPFDLVFMDLRMPGMGGLEATEQIRGLPGVNQHTPIVALTAEAYQDQIDLCFAVGMNGHVAKPFRAAQLQDIVRRQLQEHRGALACAQAQ